MTARRLELRSFVATTAAIAMASAAILFLGGCDNMERQRNYRPMEPAAQYPDGTSARPIPRFTVARDAAASSAVSLGREDGEPVADIPVPVDAALLERGRERFNIYCAVCHGPDGYGRGIVVRRGFPPPPSFHEQRLREAPAGHFFEVISYGYGAMYSYADRVAVPDRWAIVAYIRALQLSQRATLADVPAEIRRSLEESSP